MLSGCERHLDRPVCTDAIPAGHVGPWTIDDRGLARDPSTGLRWFRCNAGERFTQGACTGTPLKLDQAEAHGYALEFSAASGRPWRLPTLHEMSRLTQTQCHNPAINPQLFPSVLIEKYWASDKSPYSAWLACSMYTFNGHRHCRDLATEKRPFWLVLDQ